MDDLFSGLSVTCASDSPATTAPSVNVPADPAFGGATSSASAPKTSAFGFLTQVSVAPTSTQLSTHSHSVSDSDPSAFGFLGRSQSVGEAPRKKTRRANVPGYVSKELAHKELNVPEEENSRCDKSPTGASSSPAASVDTAPKPLPPPERLTASGTGLTCDAVSSCAVSVMSNGIAETRSCERVDNVQLPLRSSSSTAQKFLPHIDIPTPATEAALHECNSITDIHHWVQAVVEKMTAKSQSLLDTQALLHVEMQRTHEDICGVREKMDAAESEQNALCDQDRFEEAEVLNSRISVLKHRLSAKIADTTAASARRRDILDSLAQVSKEHLQLLERGHVRLKEVQAEARENLEDTDFSQRRCRVSEENRLHSEMERISLARKHLEKDAANAQEERAQVEAALHAQTKDHREELERATENAFVLEGRIKELEHELVEARKDHEAAENAISLTQTKMAAIRTKFEKQFDRIIRAEHRIEECTNEINADTQASELAQEALKKEIREREEQETGRRKELAAGAVLLKKMLRQVASCKKRNRQRERWQQKRLPFEDAVASKRNELETIQIQADRLVSELSARQNDGATVKSRLSVIASSLPQLETEKKVAVSSRNFKEAGRVAAELKRKEEERVQMEAELEESQDDLQELQVKLEEAKNAETEKTEEVRAQELTCDLKEIKILERQLHDLQRVSARAKRKANPEWKLYASEVSICELRMTYLVEKHHIDSSTVSDVEWSEERSSSSDDEPITPAVSTKVGSPTDPINHHRVTMDATPDTPESGTIDEPIEGPCGNLAILNADELFALEAEYSLRVEDAEKTILEMSQRVDQCVEAEDFETAEDVETQRTALSDELLVLRSELHRIEAAAVRGHAHSEEAVKKASEEQTKHADSSDVLAPPIDSDKPPPPLDPSPRLDSDVPPPPLALDVPPPPLALDVPPPPLALDVPPPPLALDVPPPNLDSDIPPPPLASDVPPPPLNSDVPPQPLASDVPPPPLNSDVPPPPSPPLDSDVPHSESPPAVSEAGCSPQHSRSEPPRVVSSGVRRLSAFSFIQQDADSQRQTQTTLDAGIQPSVPPPPVRSSRDPPCPIPSGLASEVVVAALAAWEENVSILHLAQVVYDATQAQIEDHPSVS